MCHLKLFEALRIVSLCVTCSSAWIVTLALKTCASHTRLSLLEEGLGNKTAFGSAEKLHSQQAKEKREGHACCKAALLAVVNLSVCTVPEGLFYFGLLLGQQMVSHCGNENSFCLFALV